MVERYFVCCRSRLFRTWASVSGGSTRGITVYGGTYRAYGTRNNIAPRDDDPACIWRGDDYAEARKVAKQANAQRRAPSEPAPKQGELFEEET